MKSILWMKNGYVFRLLILCCLATSALHCSDDSSADNHIDNGDDTDTNSGDSDIVQGNDTDTVEGDDSEYHLETLSISNCIRQCELQWECAGIEDTSVHPLYNCEASCAINVPLIECVAQYMGACGPAYHQWYSCYYSDIEDCDDYNAYIESAGAYYDDDDSTVPDMSDPCLVEFSAYYDICGDDFDTYFQDTDHCEAELAAMNDWLEVIENYTTDTDTL